MMGSRHPKAHCAASQERSLECLQTLEKLEGAGRACATFNKFGAEMAYFRQRRVRAGMMCFAGAVRQLISTFPPPGACDASASASLFRRAAGGQAGRRPWHLI
jgi:hypothetical protein